LAAEAALKPAGQLAVVTFHSVEDRMVKRFLPPLPGQGKCEPLLRTKSDGPRHSFKKILKRKAIGRPRKSFDENPRSRSASCGVAVRTRCAYCPAAIDGRALGIAYG